MLPVLSRAQMRAFDMHAIERSSVPSIVLMENAGRGATDVLVRELLSGNASGARSGHSISATKPSGNGDKPISSSSVASLMR